MLRLVTGLKLQLKFAAIVAAGIFLLSFVTIGLMAYADYSAVEQKLRTQAQNDINNGLNVLLSSVGTLLNSKMQLRFNDALDLSIKTLDSWFEARDKDSDSKFWRVWGPSITEHMKREEPTKAVNASKDDVDREVMQSGRTVGRFVGNTYRYSMPVIWGQSPMTKQGLCVECHENMGVKPNEVLAIYSISLPTSADFIALRQRMMAMAGGALIAILAMLVAIWSLFGRVVARPLRALVRPLEDIAEGNLAVQVPGLDRKDELGQIANAVNQMAGRVSATIVEIQSSGREINNASTEIASSTTVLSQRTEEQAASLEETSASMEEIAVTVRKNAENARQANEFAAETNKVAERGGAVVGDAVTAMARIEESSRKISDIIGVIDEIARQTNLLALNAAVEAARAGEAGRGFAVVASEVRSLAQRSSQAAKDIKDLIVNSNSQVKDGVDLVNRAGESLRDIVDSVRKVRDIVGEIANASGEQSAGVEQINNALAQMDEATQQNSALVEENAAAAKLLETQVQSMDAQVSYFRIDKEPEMVGNAARKQASASDLAASEKMQSGKSDEAMGAAFNTYAAKAGGSRGVGRMQAARRQAGAR